MDEPPFEPDQPPAPEFFCPLDGSKTTEEAISRRVLAVVIDNHPNARPQAGLTEACIVYEVLVEGGVTRFIAFYLHREAPVLLPIRSSRPYFHDWVMEFSAAFAHCGGTMPARDDLDRNQLLSLCEIYKAREFYERHSGRRAPHNLRSSTVRLREAVTDLGHDLETGQVPAGLFQFDPSPEREGDPASSLRLAYGLSSWPSVAEYRYDEQSGYYLRYQNGKAHTCATNTLNQIKARTVIVQQARTTVGSGPEGYLDLQLVGSGTAKVFHRGVVVDARWSKQNRSSPTVFTLADGSELILEPGPIWIQVVPLNMTIEVGE